MISSCATVENPDLYVSSSCATVGFEVEVCDPKLCNGSELCGSLMCNGGIENLDRDQKSGSAPKIFFGRF